MLQLTDQKISEDPSGGRLIETAGAEGRSANWTVCAAHSVAHCWNLRRLDDSQISFIRSAPQATQTLQLMFLHKSGIDLRPGGTADISRWRNPKASTQFFAPEAQRTLAGGGAQRNHRIWPKPISRPGRDAGPGFAAEPTSVLRPKGAGPTLALLRILVRRPYRD